MATFHEDDGHDILRMFLKGERTVIWALHIQAMYDIMPYLAASGHNLYTKCIDVYLQQMNKRHETPDLVIEQVLMRSMKTIGGLTRGRGMTETQRLVWLMAHPVCAEVNNAIEQRTGVQYNTSEQHKNLATARQVKDITGSCELLEFLESRNSFSDNCSLRSIATGINAGISGNVDTAKEVG